MGVSEGRPNIGLCPAPTKENICAIIVTYFPDAQFGERLNRIRGQVGRTLIVDNTGKATPSAWLASIDLKGVEIIRNKENAGIGEALNQGMARAVQLSFDWVITFDQDSWVRPELVEVLIQIYGQQSRPEEVGIIGCNFEEQNTKVLAMKVSPEGQTFRETEVVITSGSLLCVETFCKVGPFRSDFFIDFVDHEYCLRLLQLGYKIIISIAPLMIHALGVGSLLTLDSRVGSFSLALTNRSPLRRYYMTRNGLLVAKKYFSVAPQWMITNLISLLPIALLKIPWEGNGRLKKYRATFYGLHDAIRSKTGKAVAVWLSE